MTVLVSIQQPVAAWQIPAAAVERLRARCPDHEILHATSASARAEGLARAEVAFTWVLTAEELAHAPRLRWVHSSAVAVGTLCLPDLRARGIQVTNSRGIQSAPIAEHVLALMLALMRQVPFALDQQRQANWAQNAFTGARTPRVLRGQCLGVVGLGSIGTEVARLGAAFDMDVVAVRRDASRPVPEGVRQVWGPDGLDSLLAAADVVVLAAPLTPETDTLLDAARLGRMRPGARLVNIARGQLVDTAALVAALRSGALGGAALDVFDVEPLPAGHPLWQAPNLIITPHMSGFRPSHWDDVVDLFAANLHRFAQGAALAWPVDPARGY